MSHGPESRDMAIEIIQDVFPGVAVEWERTERVRTPTMMVMDTISGDIIATFRQHDISDSFRGPGVDTLKAALLKYKQEHSLRSYLAASKLLGVSLVTLFVAISLS